MLYITFLCVKLHTVFSIPNRANNSLGSFFTHNHIVFSLTTATIIGADIGNEKYANIGRKK